MLGIVCLLDVLVILLLISGLLCVFLVSKSDFSDVNMTTQLSQLSCPWSWQGTPLHPCSSSLCGSPRTECMSYKRLGIGPFSWVERWSHSRKHLLKGQLGTLRNLRLAW
jgi:hypothetical protein